MLEFAHWQRRGTEVADPLSERAGYPLGLLNLRGVLANAQHDAGLRYQSQFNAYTAMMGLAGPNVTAIDLGTVPERMLTDEPSEHEVARIKHNSARTLNKLRQTGSISAYACHKVCICEEMVDNHHLPPQQWTAGAGAAIPY